MERVVSRLNGDFAGRARFETIRYETIFIPAHEAPQQLITPAADCDIVVGILRWRLGTPLSPEFPDRLPDGRPYPSGTAYGLLTAIRKRQSGAPIPDVYVFRFDGSVPNPPLDDPNYDKVKREWQALSDFFAEWFRAPQGDFKAYFHRYAKEDEFEAQLESCLRQWLTQKTGGGRATRWPILGKGSPFRGLDVFGAKHAPVFFGRSREIAHAVDLWRGAAERRAPFLLLIGPSGSGKSSFARAGLVPRLSTPGVIAAVDRWRVAVMRPGDDHAGLFAALAGALFMSEADLPKDEEGRPALPELAEGDFKTRAELAAALRHADATSVKPILNALGRVGQAVRTSEHYARDVRCDLVLVVDQLDEAFDATVDAGERDAFFALLAALVATGRVWVVVSLRDAFYPQVLASPALSGLKERGASLDVAPPGPAELAEIVRDPAEAAGLEFEADAASGETLNSRILREAVEPDMLPLVQLALTRLFEAREEADGRLRLTLKAYESLGGLKGIVDEAGERALKSLGETEKARLSALLRRLTAPTRRDEGGATLTMTTGAVEGKVETVRLAHQRVLQDWGRARGIVDSSADFFAVRSDIEDGLRRYRDSKRGEDLLQGVRLAKARDFAKLYPDELSSEAGAYVKASRAKENRGLTFALGLTVLFALLAVGGRRRGENRGGPPRRGRSGASAGRSQFRRCERRHQQPRFRHCAGPAQRLWNADGMGQDNSGDGAEGCRSSHRKGARRPGA